MRSVYDLNYELISTRQPKTDRTLALENAFHFWKSSWENTYKILNVSDREQLPSDDFLDREVGALFYNEQPIGLFFNNWFDISRDSIISHSYFKNYPLEVLRYYRELGLKEVMLLSYMTLHPNWRRSQTDIQLSDVLFSLGVLRFMNGPWPALIGYIRKDNGTDKIFYRHGGIKVRESQAYNVPVDFCYLTQESAKLSDLPGVKSAALYLWEKMKTKTYHQETHHEQSLY